VVCGGGLDQLPKVISGREVGRAVLSAPYLDPEIIYGHRSKTSVLWISAFQRFNLSAISRLEMETRVDRARPAQCTARCRRNPQRRFRLCRPLPRPAISSPPKSAPKWKH
jgi:hypothetical protein